MEVDEGENKDDGGDGNDDGGNDGNDNDGDDDDDNGDGGDRDDGIDDGHTVAGDRGAVMYDAPVEMDADGGACVGQGGDGAAVGGVAAGLGDVPVADMDVDAEGVSDLLNFCISYCC